MWFEWGTRYRLQSYGDTHANHDFVNEISSPTYTTLIFVLYHIILGSFSTDTLSNLTMAIEPKHVVEIFICISKYSCVKTVYPSIIVYLWLTNTTRMTHLEVLKLFYNEFGIFCVYGSVHR